MHCVMRKRLHVLLKVEKTTQPAQVFYVSLFARIADYNRILKPFLFKATQFLRMKKPSLDHWKMTRPTHTPVTPSAALLTYVKQAMKRTALHKYSPRWNEVSRIAIVIPIIKRKNQHFQTLLKENSFFLNLTHSFSNSN